MRLLKKRTGKRLFTGILVSVLTLSATFGSGYTAQAEESDKQQYVVTMTNEVSGEVIAEKYENKLTDDYEKDGLLAEEAVVVMELSEAEAEELEKKKEVYTVEEDITFSATGKKSRKKKMTELKQLKKALINGNTNTNTEKEEWNLQMIGASTVETEAVTLDNQIKVAVLDSGIDTTNQVNVKEHINLVTEEKDIGVFFEDMTGHGTSVAGIIADINEEAQIYSVKVLDQQNRASLSRILEGIYWCIENDMDIINMSFGTSAYSASLHEAVKCAEEAGILMVASAGNGGTDAEVEYPAAFEEVVAVGAVDTSAEKTEESATGEEIELVAPGAQIKADGAFGGKIITAGTSMAVPHVVGMASVIWQKDADKSADFIRGLLKESSKELGEKESYGEGLPDLEYALEHFDEYESAYQENVDSTDVLQENREEVKTFEEVDYVEGRWGTYYHEQMQDTYFYNGTFSTAEIGFIKKCASLSDEGGTNPAKKTLTEPNKAYQDYFKYDADGKKVQYLHGGGEANYVANTTYLYQIAARLKRNPGWSVTKAISAVTYKGKDVKQENMIKRAVKFACKEFIQVAKRDNWDKTNSLTDAQKRSCIVLGMALHLAADTYAHQTVVPAGSATYGNSMGAKRFNKNDFINWKELRTEINKNNLRFGKIKSLQLKTSRVNYDDNVTFYPKRYSVGAQEAMCCILEMYVGTPALDVDGFFWFTDVVKYGGGNECRLYKLKTHSIQMHGKSYVGSSCNNDTIAD